MTEKEVLHETPLESLVPNEAVIRYVFNQSSDAKRIVDISEDVAGSDFP